MEYVIPPLLWWLPLPLLLLGAYALAQSRQAPDAVPYSSLHLLRAALEGRPSTAFRRHFPPLLLLLALALGTVALARPALRVGSPRSGRRSCSSWTSPGAWGPATCGPPAWKRRSGARDFVDTLPEGFRVGVVAFSSDASLVQPVTDDLPAVNAAIAELQLGGGTAIGEGLEVALAALPPELVAPPGAITSPGGAGSPRRPGRLRRAGPAHAPAGAAPGPPAGDRPAAHGRGQHRGVPPLESTARARDVNVPVFTIGMGGRGGGLPFGGGSRGSVDEELLQEMAAQTGGQYYFAPTGGDLRRIYNDLGVALGWDFQRQEIGHLFGAGALGAAVAGLVLAFLWLHRQP